MANPKQDMFNRISKLSKNAPLQESAGAVSPATSNRDEIKASDLGPALSNEDSQSPKRKVKAVRRAKNVQIPEDLWDAYDTLKEKNVTSLLMTPYILEAFREKLARDGAFEKK